MYKRNKVKKLGRTRSHREALINNQLKTLFEYGYVRTTTPKAKVLKTRADRLISRYSSSLSFRREMEEIFGNKKLVNLYVKYAKKESKGVKILKVGFRPGDMSEVSRVELLNFKEKKVVKQEPGEKKEKKEKKKENSTAVDKKILGRDKQKVSVKKNMRVSKERAKSRSGL